MSLRIKNAFQKMNMKNKNQSLIERACKVVRSADEFDKWLDVYSASFGIDIEKRATIRTSLQKENFRESKFILYEQKLKDKSK